MYLVADGPRRYFRNKVYELRICFIKKGFTASRVVSGFVQFF